MTGSTIAYKIALVIQLIDAATGKSVSERNVRFEAPGEKLKPVYKGSEGFVLINRERTDFSFKVSVYGYEETTVSVCYAKLSQEMPVLEVYLLPIFSDRPGAQILCYEGSLTGIEAVEAVILNRTDCCVLEMDERRRIVKLSNPHGADLSDTYYGIIRQEQERFDHVKVVKAISQESLKLDRVVEIGARENPPFARVIFGRAAPDGSYRLCVKDDSSECKCLVRYVVNGQERFQAVDMLNTAERKLE